MVEPGHDLKSADRMITVGVRYHNMLRHAAGVRDETVALPAASLLTALKYLVDRHGPRLGTMLFSPEGGISPHLVIFRNGQLATHDQYHIPLADGDELMLFPVVSGG